MANGRALLWMFGDVSMDDNLADMLRLRLAM